MGEWEKVYIAKIIGKLLENHDVLQGILHPPVNIQWMCENNWCMVVVIGQSKICTGPVMTEVQHSLITMFSCSVLGLLILPFLPNYGWGILPYEAII